MTIESILSQIDAEIASLQQAKALLSGATSARRSPGRPPGAVKAITPQPKKRRTLTPEGRARIAAAVKARWAAQKKAARATSKRSAKKAGRKEAPQFEVSKSEA